ncbi:MAG TPA: ABC transporter ATPase [Sphingobacteriaceae bacterium]
MQISENSRVWIYQANREFTPQEITDIQETLNRFTAGWLAHGAALAATAEIRYGRFIILSVDETQAGATGCSIDQSVNLMKEIGNRYQVDLFDRFNIAYRHNGQILAADRAAFEDLIRQGIVSGDTIVFNNLVSTGRELASAWEIPMKESWHARVFA